MFLVLVVAALPPALKEICVMEVRAVLRLASRVGDEYAGPSRPGMNEPSFRLRSFRAAGQVYLDPAQSPIDVTDMNVAMFYASSRKAFYDALESLKSGDAIEAVLEFTWRFDKKRGDWGWSWQLVSFEVMEFLEAGSVPVAYARSKE